MQNQRNEIAALYAILPDMDAARFAAGPLGLTQEGKTVMSKFYKLTKLDIAALRKCDLITVALDRVQEPETRVHVIKEAKKTEADPFATDIYHAIPAPVRFKEFIWSRDTSRARCFSLIYNYHNQITPVTSILRTLRAGDEIAFVFCPDAHTTGNLAAVSYHGDALYLEVAHDGRLAAEFELDNGVGPDNTSRMCRGIPNTESYERDRKQFARC